MKHINHEKDEKVCVYDSKIPIEKIAFDIKGPITRDDFITKSDKKIFYIVAISDMTKSTQTELVSSIRSEDIQRAIQKIWIDRFGILKLLLSDQGRQFISHGFKRFSTINKIRQITTTSYNPTCNEVVARIYKTIGEILRIQKGTHFKKITKFHHPRLRYLSHNNKMSPTACI